MPPSVFTDVVAYPLERFLSDVGGSAGLILGMSAFTIFLIIEGIAFFTSFHYQGYKISKFVKT